MDESAGFLPVDSLEFRARSILLQSPDFSFVMSYLFYQRREPGTYERGAILPIYLAGLAIAVQNDSTLRVMD
jgi:hypothetical protein